RLGIGSGDRINDYVTSEPFPISTADQWQRLQFIFNVGSNLEQMSTILILPDPQQIFYFDEISLTKLQNLKTVPVVSRESELLESMYIQPVSAYNK
ncbi:hypothetical protein ACUOFC_49565, partial [Escherichia sp. TWPC-MK]